jgi:adenylate cyclase
MPTAADGTPLEIERTYLLDRMPDLPPGHEVLEIEQGYLSIVDDQDEGRVRRTRKAGGVVVCKHTVKKGTGLVRTEVERTIPEAEFLALWPRTAGMRLAKSRHVVEHGAHVWEIDRFHDLPLVLAEVELPSADVVPELPPWLAPRVVRDVTEEAEYRNSSIARRLGRT